ncbi:MAG: flagellar hook-length control protein FliK [Treponema sp.]|jgi:flagellar hook-length control protein FliK|nr:flagellar hook-length control protein FliK [Treponema sp.]
MDLQLQVSAQTGSQTISKQNEVSAVSNMSGKIGKSNKLGAFAKMLDGLRVVSPQQSMVGGANAEAAGGAVKKHVQQFVARKNQPKTAQTRETLSIAEQHPVESKKRKFSQQQEARGIEAFFVNKVQDSIGKNRKTASSPSGVEQGKKELSVNAQGVALPKAAAPANIQEAGIPAVGSDAPSLKPVASAAETALKTSGRKKEAAPNTNEIPPGVAGQPLLTKETVARQQVQKADGEGKVAKAKRKDKFNVEIHDARTIDSSAAQPQSLQANAVRTGVDATEITFDLNRAKDAPETEAPDKANSSQNFADMLSHALGDTLSNDIVRQAAIVLRDGGQGTIRLSLKPESLGNVKIRLELAENKITGTIFVSSEEAYRAFEKEVHTLEQAFKESGFESAALNTTFASGDGRSGRQWDDTERRYFSERFAVERYDAAEALETVHALEAGWEPEQRIAVNMFV